MLFLFVTRGANLQEFTFCWSLVPRHRLWWPKSQTLESQDPSAVVVQHMTLPRFHMTSKDIQPFIIPQTLRHRQQMRQGEKRDQKKEVCRNNHSPPPHIQLSTIWNHFCYVILFATKWGLDFHGLYHIVLCCTRLQSEVGGRGQSEREGVYICLVCGLMAPYVCEEKWQPEVGSERRPTTPPRSRSARHHPSFRFMPQTYLPSMNAVLPSLTGDVLSVSTHKVDRVKASATLWISLTLQPFLYPCVTNVPMVGQQ